MAHEDGHTQEQGFVQNTFPRSLNAVDQAVNRFVRGKANDIDNPFLRGLANSLLDGVLGTSGDNLQGNGYANAVAAKTAQARQELNNIVSRNTGDSGGGLSGNTTAKPYDWRARLRPKRGGETTFYQKMKDSSGAVKSDLDYLLAPIEQSGGLVWQYTPNIFLSGSANYDSSDFQGQNYPINTFINSSPPEIPVTSDWTANDAYEARYLLAVTTFLKIATKAYYGDTAVASGKYGTPPPVMLFEYLGDHGFNKIPVIITNYTIQYPDDVDYVPVVVNSQTTFVPTRTNIMVNLKPQVTPMKLRRYFDLEKVASGQLYKGGFI